MITTFSSISCIKTSKDHIGGGFNLLYFKIVPYKQNRKKENPFTLRLSSEPR